MSNILPGWYFRLSEFFSRRFSCKVRKIPVHAGTTCPNRDGTISTTGCSFCYNPGFSPATGKDLSISSQIRQARDGLKPAAREKTRFLAYFQSYTNTYGDPYHLISQYKEALQEEGVMGISVSTRPDCIPEEILEYLEETAKQKHVWLEYGLQSAHDHTLEKINRGHDSAAFTRAVERTRNRGIFICAHIILGLPGESWEDMRETIRFLNRSGIDGVKFHHLQVIKNTSLAEEYRKKTIPLFRVEEYLHLLVELLEHLSPELCIHRLMSEVTDPELLIGPRWDLVKTAFHQEVEKELKNRNSCQGSNVLC